MKRIEALGLIGWLILELSAWAAAAPPLARPGQSPPSLNLIHLPTTVLDPTTNLSNTNNSGTISEIPPQHSRGNLESVYLDFYDPEMIYYLRHAERVEKVLHRALEDVADHAEQPSQWMGTEMRLYSSQDWDNGAAVEIVLWPKAVTTWEMWKHTLIAMKIYALRYPTYDFKFAMWVRDATEQEAGIGFVKTRH